MERCHPHYGITGSDIDTSTSRPRSHSYNPLPQRAQDNETKGLRRPSSFSSEQTPKLARAASIHVLTDPRLPARIARTATLDAGDEVLQSRAAVRVARYSHRTTDSELTSDSERGRTPSLEEDLFQSHGGDSQDATDVMGGSASEREWKQRMSEYVSNLPNFALGSTTRAYTQKRPRLHSDSGRYQDAVSLEKYSQRSRKGTYSSSDTESLEWSVADTEAQSPMSGNKTNQKHSTFSRLSSCSSRDSIQHWVDSLDVDDNENNNVIVAEHLPEQGVLDTTLTATSGTSLEYNDGSNVENIPGYGVHNKKGGPVSVDDLSLGADASCIAETPRGDVDGNHQKPRTQRVRGPGGRQLERKITNSQLIEQAEQHRTLQGRRKQLHHMGGSGVSDVPSGYSISTASSVAELLFMRNDPEAILLALGFGGNKKSDPLNRIPNRFLQHSRMNGISVQEFLHRMEMIEKGVGFNLNGGLRGLEYVLDRRRTNSLKKQISVDEESILDVKQASNNMGDSGSKETPAPSIEPERAPSPPAEPIEPSLEEIYTQQQPTHSRLYSSADSRDTGSLMSSMDSVMSEFDSGLDRIGHRNSVEHLMYRDNSVIKDADKQTSEILSKDSSNVSKKDSSHVSKKDSLFDSSKHSVDVSSKESSLDMSSKDSSAVPSKDSSSVSNNDSSNVSKEVFHSDTEPQELDIPDKDQHEVDPDEHTGELSEERIKEIREELMLRALIVRARMVIPSPQLDPVDEETESEPRSPYRIGSLDLSPTTPDAKMSFTNSDGDKKKSPDVTRAYSTSELELHQRAQVLSSTPKADKKKNVPDTGNKDDIGTTCHQDVPKEDSNKLKPVSATHKVATERLMKDSAHGGQESFEIEEISSTENQEESGNSPNSNKTNEKPSEHGTLSRNPSTQSDSSGFADEGDTPNSNKESSHVTMVTSEMQTSFDTVRLDSYDPGSASPSGSVETVLVDRSRPDSVDTPTTPCGINSQTGSVDAPSEEDMRRIVERRESFRKSRGTSIVTSKAFSSVAFDDDDAFEADIADVCTTDTEAEHKARNSRPHPLRRSGTFPGLPMKSHREGGPTTVPEILSSLQESVQKATLASQDQNKMSSLPSQEPIRAALSERKKLMSRIRSVDVESNYPYEGHLRSSASKPVSSTASVMGDGDKPSKELVLGDIETNVQVTNLQPVCEEDIVPSSRDKSECYLGNQSSQHPVHHSNRQHSTQSKREPIPQCISPTIEPWDPSDVDRYSPDQMQFPRYCSPTGELLDTSTTTSRCSPMASEPVASGPFGSYSPMLSPPRNTSATTQTLASTTQQHMVLPLRHEEETSKSDSKTPSSDSTWQVTDTSHLLEQHRHSEGSPTPRTSCVSELNARCEPREAALTLRSSFEMDISSVNSADVVTSIGGEERCLPKNMQGLQEQPIYTYQLSEEDKAENWHKAMSSTPRGLPDKTLNQYEAEDVHVLHTALQKYKNDLAKLEDQSDMVYGHVESDLTEKDRNELDALSRVRGQIMGEITTMESLLAKKLQVVSTEHKASVDSDEAELLAASAENLDIIREMVGLLEEQRSMQQFLQDIGTHTDISSNQAAASPLQASSESASSFHETSNDNLLEEMQAMKREMEDYRIMAQKELKEAVSEAKEDEITRLRSLLGETPHLHEMPHLHDTLHPHEMPPTSSSSSLRLLLGETEHLLAMPPPTISSSSLQEKTQRRKDELKQLKDLLLKKSGCQDNDRNSQSEDEKR